MSIFSNIRKQRVLLLAGLSLLVITGSVFIFFYLNERNAHSSVRRQDNFNRLLGEYDTAMRVFYRTESEFAYFNGQLDNLEKRAISVESWLSILKRRKALADIHFPSSENYRKSIENALNAFPLSQPVIAAACAFYVKNTKITEDTETRLRSWLPFLINPEFNELRLSVHVLLGDFHSPASASYLPINIFNVTPVDFVRSDAVLSGSMESILTNFTILKTLKGDYRGALADIQSFLDIMEYDISLSDITLRFAAEYHYDFGNLLRCAEISSYLNDEVSLIRQADALYLAGYHDMAAVIWKILSEQQDTQFEHIKDISLYNLFMISDNQAASLSFLDTLVNNADTEVNKNNPLRSLAWQFGLVRYSRFMDYQRASALLRNNNSGNYPYIDLEICKRLSYEQNPGRQMAQTWLLLDRHEKNKDMYNWAAWLFLFHRNYEEARILLDRFDRYQFSDNWADVYRAIRLMNEGRLEEAEKIFYSITDAGWVIYANIGRIFEAVLSPLRAIEQYNLAAEKIDLSAGQNNKIASRIQIRIARCLVSLNRIAEARTALQYALTLDGENLSARLELDRISR